MNNIPRRQFLKITAAAAGTAMVTRSIPRAWAANSATVAITPPLSVFGYSQVQLLDGPFREQFDQNHDLFLHIDEDALLKPFRQREGMPAPGPDMGGWYDNATDFTPMENFHGFIPGIASVRSLRIGSRLCNHRIETDPRKSEQAGSCIRANRGPRRKVLCGLLPSRVHLRQNQLRSH